jgi:Multicopper oxidase
MIVGRSSNFSDPELSRVVEGQANPIRRDVYQIPSGESITLRVIADNPGTWFFHCKSSLFFYSIVNLSFFFFFFLNRFSFAVQVTSNGISKSD